MHTVGAVSKCYCRVLSGMNLSSVAFDKINGSAAADSITIWAAKEKHAKRECLYNVTVMDIYDIRMERRKFDYYALGFPDKLL